MKWSNTILIILLIAIIFVAFLINDNYNIISKLSVEKYGNSDYELINPKDLGVIQGVAGSDMQLKPFKLDTYNELPSVDGTAEGPQSMFAFAFNKCSPECCKANSGGYSCSGGCVCLTDKQKKYFASRGVNSTPTKCSWSEY